MVLLECFRLEGLKLMDNQTSSTGRRTTQFTSACLNSLLVARGWKPVLASRPAIFLQAPALLCLGRLVAGISLGARNAHQRNASLRPGPKLRLRKREPICGHSLSPEIVRS